jgi:hypothetical protein
MSVFSELTTRWAAIAAEIADYATRSFGDSSATLYKLASVKSLEEAIHVQTEYANRTYDRHLKQLAKLSVMCADLATSGTTTTQF